MGGSSRVMCGFPSCKVWSLRRVHSSTWRPLLPTKHHGPLETTLHDVVAAANTYRYWTFWPPLFSIFCCRLLVGWGTPAASGVRPARAPVKVVYNDHAE